MDEEMVDNIGRALYGDDEYCPEIDGPMVRGWLAVIEKAGYVVVRKGGGVNHDREPFRAGERC